MHAPRHLPSSIQARDTGRGRFGVHSHSTHNVVTGWANFHGLRGNIEVPKLFELMIHTRELAFDRFRIALVSDIQKHTAVRTAATGEHLSPNSACHDVTRQQVWRPSCVPVALQPAFSFLWSISRLGG